MRKLNSSINVITSDPAFPNGRIRNNTGTGNGTPVNEQVYGDIHTNKDKLLDLYGIDANNLPDNETNGYQYIDALRALASKNDFILPLTNNAGVLSVPIKLGFMVENEQVICKAGFDLGVQTEIKGLDASTFSFTSNGSFKTNEYVRLIKNASGITIIRLADALSLDSMVSDLLYLKKCTQTEENNGTIDTKATTPLTNLTAFIRRVIGTDSGSYLATAIRNGLYPKEHFEIVENLVNPVKNIGWFSGLDVGGSVGSLPVNGNITSAVATNSGGASDESFVLVTLQNAMVSTNYFVRCHVESQGTIGLDNDINQVVFKPISSTQLQISLSSGGLNTQSLKIHVEVVQL
jgi:hypothetical protein